MLALNFFCTASQIYLQDLTGIEKCSKLNMQTVIRKKATSVLLDFVWKIA